MFKNLVCFIVIAFTASSVSAHDFWLEPDRYTTDPGKEIGIDWRIGEGFLGETLVYLPFNAERAEVWNDGKVRKLSPRFASKPALKVPAPNTGTAIVITVTPEFELTYDSWEEFESFVTKEKIPYSLPDPQAPPIEEKYIRYAKTLITSDAEQWQDQRIELLYEWVVERVSGTEARARLWYDGKPAAQHTAKIFRKDADVQDDVVPKIGRTDEDGYYQITGLQPGDEVLLNAIQLENFPDSDTYPWLSHWASLTFAW